MPVDFADPRTEAYGLFERQDAWSSCACFYLDRPENDLPLLPEGRPDRRPARVRRRGGEGLKIGTHGNQDPGALDTRRRDLRPDQLEELRDACDRVVKAMRDQEQTLREAGR